MVVSVVVAVSRCSDADRARILQGVTRLGGLLHTRGRRIEGGPAAVVSTWGGVTHCVQWEEDAFSYQDLACAVLGKWVLARRWLEDSLTLGTWAAPEHYAAAGDEGRRPLELPAGSGLFVTGRFYARGHRPEHWARCVRSLFAVAGGDAHLPSPVGATHFLTHERDDPGHWAAVPGANVAAVELTLREATRWLRYGGDARGYGRTRDGGGGGGGGQRLRRPLRAIDPNVNGPPQAKKAKPQPPQPPQPHDQERRRREERRRRADEDSEGEEEEEEAVVVATAPPPPPRRPPLPPPPRCIEAGIDVVAPAPLPPVEVAAAAWCAAVAQAAPPPVAGVGEEPPRTTPHGFANHTPCRPAPPRGSTAEAAAAAAAASGALLDVSPCPPPMLPAEAAGEEVAAVNSEFRELDPCEIFVEEGEGAGGSGWLPAVIVRVLRGRRGEELWRYQVAYGSSPTLAVVEQRFVREGAGARTPESAVRKTKVSAQEGPKPAQTAKGKKKKKKKKAQKTAAPVLPRGPSFSPAPRIPEDEDEPAMVRGGRARKQQWADACCEDSGGGESGEGEGGGPLLGLSDFFLADRVAR